MPAPSRRHSGTTDRRPQLARAANRPRTGRRTKRGLALAPKDESFAAFDGPIVARGLSTPWHGVTYKPDYELLEQLLSIPIGRGELQQSGRVVKALDAWLAYEFRRAGFDEAAVWPRVRQPRVLPTALAPLETTLEGIEAQIENTEQRRSEEIMPASIRKRIFALRRKLGGEGDARVLGRFYVKQIDVAISSWTTGPELLISTKSQFSSYANNRQNRFEEAVGDATNLRTRYPLAAIAYVMLVRSNISQEREAMDLMQDLLRKLASAEGGYDASALLVADWEDGADTVKLRRTDVPEDLSLDHCLHELIDRILERTPIKFHVKARELRLNMDLDLDEEGETELEET